MGGLVFPQIDNAIARFEGFGKPGVYATLNNNPGNIISGPFADAHGATGSYGGFAVFPDAATGMVATDALVGYYARQKATIESLINKWAPGAAKGNTQAGTDNYTKTVAEQLGASPGTPVSAFDRALGMISDAATGVLGTTGQVPRKDIPVPSPSDIVKNIPGGAALSGLSNISWTRAAAFLVGLAALIVGLVSLHTGGAPETIVVSGVKKAASVVTEAA